MVRNKFVDFFKQKDYNLFGCSLLYLYGEECSFFGLPVFSFSGGDTQTFFPLIAC